jgi:hypothetical protein
MLGDAGWLRYVVPLAHGGIFATLAFAMQGLGSASIALYRDQKLVIASQVLAEAEKR